MRLSLTMVVRDEEHHLPEALASLQGVADEAVIVDTGSRDRTPEIARAFGARVLTAPWQDDFAAARNLALAAARSDWILVLDADERLEGQPEVVKGAIRDRQAIAYHVPIVSPLGSGKVDRHSSVRLFRRLPGIHFERAFHEQVLPSILRVRPQARILPAPFTIRHLGYLPAELTRKGKRLRNLRLAEQEVARRPDDAFAQANLAIEHLAAGNLAEALTHFRSAQAQYGAPEPWQARADKLAALTMLASDDPEGARETLTRALSQHPGFTDLWHVLGLTDQRLGQEEAAEAAFRHALRLGPAPSPPYDGVDPDLGGWATHHALALLLLDHGRTEEARHHLDEAAAGNPTSLELALSFVRWAEVARTDPADLLTSSPLDPLWLAAACYRRGHGLAARAALAEAERRHPSLPYDHVLLKAELELQLDGPEAAYRILARNPPPPDHPRRDRADRIAFLAGAVTRAELEPRYPPGHPFWQGIAR